MDFELITA